MGQGLNTLNICNPYLKPPEQILYIWYPWAGPTTSRRLHALLGNWGFPVNLAGPFGSGFKRFFQFRVRECRLSAGGSLPEGRIRDDTN